MEDAESLDDKDIEAELARELAALVRRLTRSHTGDMMCLTTYAAVITCVSAVSVLYAVQHSIIHLFLRPLRPHLATARHKWGYQVLMLCVRLPRSGRPQR